MTVAIVNTALTDNFNTWLNNTNRMAEGFRHEVVSISNTTSGNSTGNGFITGIFGASTLTATTALRGGNVSSSNTLTITSNVAVSNVFTVTGNTVLANVTIENVTSVLSVANSITINTNATMLVTANTDLGSNVTAGQVVLSFDKAVYFTAEFSVASRKSGNNQIQKGIVSHDGTNVEMAIYGTVSAPSSANLGTISAAVSTNTTHIDLAFTQTAANTSVKVAATLLK